MRHVNDMQLKRLIELSNNFYEADQVISQYTECKNTKEKLVFVKELFDIQKPDNSMKSDEFKYESVIKAIIRKKYL